MRTVRKEEMTWLQLEGDPNRPAPRPEDYETELAYDLAKIDWDWDQTIAKVGGDDAVVDAFRRQLDALPESGPGSDGGTVSDDPVQEVREAVELGASADELWRLVRELPYEDEEESPHPG